METPEFLIWAVEQVCPVRGLQTGSDPERTERQLRAARAVSDARRDGRMFEGLCVDPPDGFRVEDALQVYGNKRAVEESCCNCPANALAADDPLALAGCYGLVPLPRDSAAFHAAIDQAVEITRPELRPATRTHWYGLWLNAPLAAERLLETFLVLQAAPIDDADCRRAMAELLLGLNAAFNAGSRLHVRLFPRGRVEETGWRLVPHCPRCQAEWPEYQARQCQVCGQPGHPADDRKRHARGKRPYFPLDRLLGDEQAAEFLVRYAAFRGQQASPDPAEIQPPPARPDSLPAG